LRCACRGGCVDSASCCCCSFSSFSSFSGPLICVVVVVVVVGWDLSLMGRERGGRLGRESRVLREQA